MSKQKIPGYIMAGIGFLILLTNALSYIFGWGTKHPSLTIFGLVFVLVGLKTARQPSE